MRLLGCRLGPDDDVAVLAVVGDGLDERDAGEALNVARVRLDHVETVVREGEPAETILGVAAERGADGLVVGPRSGVPGAGEEVGATARAVLVTAPIPVVVVALPPLS